MEMGKVKIYKTHYLFDNTTQFSFVEDDDKDYLFVLLNENLRRDVCARSGCTWKTHVAWNELKKVVTESNELEVLIVLGHTADKELERINKVIGGRKIRWTYT